MIARLAFQLLPPQDLEVVPSHKYHRNLSHPQIHNFERIS